MVDGVASRDLDELLQRHEKELAEAETEFRLQSRLEATLPVMRRRWRSGWTQRRVAEVFVNVLEAVAPFQAFLEACREQGLDWRTVCAQAPDLARAERDYRDFLAVSSTAELWNLLCERMAGEPPPRG